MALHGVFADEQRIRDLVIRESLRKEGCDLALAHGQTQVVAGPTAPTRTTEDRADHDFARVDCRQRFHERLGRNRLREHTARPGYEDRIELSGWERPRVHH